MGKWIGWVIMGVECSRGFAETYVALLIRFSSVNFDSTHDDDGREHQLLKP